MPTQEPGSSPSSDPQPDAPRTGNPQSHDDDDDEGLYDPFTFERIGTRASRQAEAVIPSPHADEIEAWLAEAFPEANARREERERIRRLSRLRSRRIARRTYPLQLGREHGNSPPLCVRLPRWLEEQVREELTAIGVSLSEGLRQILEEWWVHRHYPALEYRNPEFRRLAAIRGGATVAEWFAAKPNPPLPNDIREQVLDYIELFRSRIEAARGTAT